MVAFGGTGAVGAGVEGGAPSRGDAAVAAACGLSLSG